MRNRTKINENSINNPSKNTEHAVHGGRPGATLGVFGVMLVESDEFWPHFGRIFLSFSFPHGSRSFKMGSWAVLGAKLGFEMGQNRFQALAQPLSIS